MSAEVGSAPAPLGLACPSCLAGAGEACRFSGGLVGFHLSRAAAVLGPVHVEPVVPAPDPEVPRYLVTNPDDTSGGVVTREVIDPARLVMEVLMVECSAYDGPDGDEEREAIVAGVLEALGMAGAI